MQISINQNLARIDRQRFNSSFVIEVKRGGKTFTSTAVAINKRVLLTAAHCIDQACTVSVVIGESYRLAEQRAKAIQWLIHPAYNPGKSFYENDLALIFLDEDLPAFTNWENFSSHLALVNGELLERIGFGGRDKQNTRTRANPIFKSLNFNKKTLVLEDEQSVVGDSGGPVYSIVDGQYQLIGIHSTLEGDNKTYAVNLAYYYDWIAAQLLWEDVI